jgi:hypothetical protein
MTLERIRDYRRHFRPEPWESVIADLHSEADACSSRGRAFDLLAQAIWIPHPNRSAGPDGEDATALIGVDVNAVALLQSALMRFPLKGVEVAFGDDGLLGAKGALPHTGDPTPKASHGDVLISL